LRMFKDTKIDILQSPLDAPIKTIDADVQPFSKSIAFEDGFQIEITSRLFCDTDDLITEESYIEFASEMYKVMEIKKWDNYLEIYLYKLKRQV